MSLFLCCGFFIGANIAAALRDIGDEWLITHKVRILVPNSASNKVLASKILRPLNWYHLQCMTHKLNQVVQDTKDNEPAL